MKKVIESCCDPASDRGGADLDQLGVRSDLGLSARLTWGIAAIVPFVPFVYVLTGNDFL